MPPRTRYLSARALHQGLGYGVEVGFAAEEPVEEDQGGAVPLAVEDIIGQADGLGSAGGTGAQKNSQNWCQK